MITRVTKNWTTGVETVDRLYVGATLALHWNSTRVMSDVWENLPYATVVDADGMVKVVHRDSTKHATDTVDATPAAIDAANAWLLKAATAARKSDWDKKVAAAVADAKALAKGKTVVVTRGRKVPVGTTGELFWLGDGRYGLRAGVRDASGTVHWTAASNLDVVNPDDYFDYDAWVTREPDHGALALRDLNSTARDHWGRKFGVGVRLFAGEDSWEVSDWFAAAPAAAA